jgi:hypothetical protein
MDTTVVILREIMSFNFSLAAGSSAALMRKINFSYAASSSGKATISGRGGEHVHEMDGLIFLWN